MMFYFDKSWHTLIKTAAGSTSLKVDTGACLTCLSITDLASLLNKEMYELMNFVISNSSVTLRTINNDNVVLYPVTLPKVAVGDRIFPEFYCLISLQPSFKSVLGLDVLRCGITYLQFQSKGNCTPFDFEMYKKLHDKLPFKKLDFLDYPQGNEHV